MPALPKDMVAIAIKTGASARAEVKTPPRFKAGDKVGDCQESCVRS